MIQKLHWLPLNLPVDVQKTELSQLSIASKMERVGNKASRRLLASVGAPTPHFPGVGASALSKPPNPRSTLFRDRRMLVGVIICRLRAIGRGFPRRPR